jgi:hypothetical protein
MTNKEFIPYKEAQALKELGFDEPCLSYYVSEKFGLNLTEDGIGVTKDILIKDGVIAPLYQQAFRWFREEHGLGCYIERTVYGCIYWLQKREPGDIVKIDSNRQLSNWSYEDAELECLRNLIEIVNQNKDE